MGFTTDDVPPVDPAARMQTSYPTRLEARNAHHRENARRAGAQTSIPSVLSTFGYARVIFGEVALAESLLDEIRAGTEANTARGEGFVLGIARQATAALNNGLGRYDVALAAVREAVDVASSDEMGSPGTMPELVEAAVRSGEHRLAARALERLAQSTRAADTDWGRGLEARSRALLADGDAADGLYREAIDRLGRTRHRLQLARAHLLYGEWLRRERRRVDAREQLGRAFDRFTAMGAAGFADRAARELQATGATARKRTFDQRDALTPQEEQIARLAGEGLSNPEIGARLFISPRTVQHHLHKVFAKLGIGSRNQLHRVLSGPAPAAGSAGTRARPSRTDARRP